MYSTIIVPDGPAKVIFAVGFMIAFAVGLTGVGAGSITAPVLILFFGLPATASVGTALAYAAVIKFAVSPMYLIRRQVDLRILALLCVGGVPGVIGGVLLVEALHAKRYERLVMLLVGGTVALMATYSLIRALRKKAPITGRDRSGWLPIIALGIGAEVGFSSAGAGALGSLMLMNLTTLLPAKIVGTDMLFGLVVSLIGGGFHVTTGNYDSAILPKLLAGGIIGVYTGAYFSSRLPARPLRITLSFCLVGLGIQLFLRGIS